MIVENRISHKENADITVLEGNTEEIPNLAVDISLNGYQKLMFQYAIPLAGDNVPSSFVLDPYLTDYNGVEHSIDMENIDAVIPRLDAYYLRGFFVIQGLSGDYKLRFRISNLVVPGAADFDVILSQLPMLLIY